MISCRILYAFVFLSFFFLFGLSFFLLSCLIFVFSQSHPVDQGIQLEEKWGRQYQRVAAPQLPAIPAFFSVGGESSSPSPSRAFILAPPSTRVLIIPCRPTLRVFFAIYEAAAAHSELKPSKRTWHPNNASWLSNGVPP